MSVRRWTGLGLKVLYPRRHFETSFTLGMHDYRIRLYHCGHCFPEQRKLMLGA